MKYSKFHKIIIKRSNYRAFSLLKSVIYFQTFGSQEIEIMCHFYCDRLDSLGFVYGFVSIGWLSKSEIQSDCF